MDDISTKKNPWKDVPITGMTRKETISIVKYMFHV
jgi:hypothetical protein